MTSIIKPEPVFYDCEASRLDGHIIEVGWAYWEPKDEKIVSAGYLIQPEPEWDIADSWDEQAEALHGISLDQLKRDGFPSWQIARKMNEQLEGRELFSDSPKDEVWVGQMFDAAGLEPSFIIRRMDADALIRKELKHDEFELFLYEDMKRRIEQKRKHRAEADAADLVLLWSRSCKS